MKAQGTIKVKTGSGWVNIPILTTGSTDVTNDFGPSEKLAISQKSITERFNKVEQSILEKKSFVKLTQQQYDQLPIKDPGTMYCIVEL